MLQCIVVGCGWAGTLHLQAVETSPYGTLVGAVEKDAKRREQVQKTYQIPVFSSLEELFESEVVFDTAVIATPTAEHKAQCLLLAERKKNILCEKPVSRTVEDIVEIKQAIEAKDIQFGTVFNQRHGFAVALAKSLISEQEETIHLINLSMFQHWPRTLGGNVDSEEFIITDACCHLLDLLTYFAGPVEQVKSIAKKVNSELYSEIGALFSFKTGGIGLLSHSNQGGKLGTQHPFQTLDIHTDTARYQMDSLCKRLTVYPHGKKERHVYEPSCFEESYYPKTMIYACQEFLKAVAERGEVPVDITDALVNLEIIKKIIKDVKEC